MDPEFENLLKRTIGLDAASIGPMAVERAVHQRMAASGLHDEPAYLDRLAGSAAELQELIEAVVVSETWFFRDREAFHALGDPVAAEWARTHGSETLRLLSLPCSTGEEPYSLAMALLDAGFSPNRFTIDAVDISQRALAHAQRGVYGKNSFRGDDLEFRDRHFESAAGGWRVSPALRQQVRFQPGNLFDRELLSGAAPYDVIFCRNVLIYFDRPTQDAAVATLNRLLAPDGFLFVGPSETGLLLNHLFTSARFPLAFAFRRADPPRREEKITDVRPLRRPIAAVPPRPVPFKAAAIAPAPVAAAMPDELDTASRLADRGELVEAVKLCEAHLRAHGPSARAFHLMGLVRDASGSHAEAAEFYRKTLYLDPQHQEALVHLAALREAQGDRAGARVLSDRARRSAARSVK